MKQGYSEKQIKTNFPTALLYYFNQSFIAIYFQVDSLIKSVTIPQRISPFMFISLKRLTHAFVDNPPS